MRFRSLIPVLALVIAFATTACTKTITLTEDVYPTQLNVPNIGGPFSFEVGSGYGIGVTARIIGKDHFEPSDSISFVVRDPSVVRYQVNSEYQSVCPTDGITAVCVGLNVDFNSIKVGSTYVVFKFEGQTDSIPLQVNPQQKGE